MDKYKFYSEQNKKRQNTTKAEAHLWSYFNQWKTGYRCVREYVIRPYIADFAFPDIQLVVEADGSYHKDRLEYDNRRTAYLSSKGWSVLRFDNERIINDTKSVLSHVIESADLLAESRGVEPRIRRGRSPCGRIKI